MGCVAGCCAARRVLLSPVCVTGCLPPPPDVRVSECCMLRTVFCVGVLEAQTPVRGQVPFVWAVLYGDSDSGVLEVLHNNFAQGPVVTSNCCRVTDGTKRCVQAWGVLAVEFAVCVTLWSKCAFLSVTTPGHFRAECRSALSLAVSKGLFKVVTVMLAMRGISVNRSGDVTGLAPTDVPEWYTDAGDQLEYV